MMTNRHTFTIKGKALKPVVQGGMGVGVSAHRLAGTVAQCGGMGTISCVDLRHLHPDLLEETENSKDKERINEVNLIALDREIKAAHAIAQGNGLIAVNIMRAVSDYAAYVKQACESGAQAIVVGAGLPLDLPDLTVDYPDIALIPILSDARGVGVVLKKWLRKNRLPDAIVIENPQYAGGHLGAPNPDDIQNPHFAFAQVIKDIQELFAKMDIAPEQIPIISAGGVSSYQDAQERFALGAAAIQLGTAFAVTQEGDADIRFKEVLVNAKPEDIVTFMSCAGLPARGVKTPWLLRQLKNEEKLADKASEKPCTVGFDCLAQCGWRDGNPKAGQFCINTRLTFALKGDVERGLFFRGSEPLPFGEDIRPVKDLISYLTEGNIPA